MHTFIWYDLMTPNLDGSKEFYAHVVGWRIADSGMPGMEYEILHAGDTMVGGMMRTPPNMMEGAEGRPWMGHIHTADADKTAEKAVALGGKIYAPASDIPGIGRFAVLGDTSGAAFIAFAPNSSEGPQKAPMGTPGHIGWRDLQSSDWRKDWDFYSALFGWRKSEAMDMGPLGTYQIFAADGEDIGGMMTKRPGDSLPPRWSYYFNVDSISAGIARAKAKGASISGPMEVPGGYAADGTDPFGVPFSLYSNNS